MKSPTQMGYTLARRELNNQWSVDPSPFLSPADNFISPTLVGEWLMDERNADEDDAFEWAILWMDQPHLREFIDPLML